MPDACTADLCVIGAGAAALTVAAGAAQLGAAAVVVDAGLGDGRDAGYLSSQALTATAHAATRLRRGRAGLRADGDIDFATVMAEARAMAAAAAAEWSRPRLEGLGAKFVPGHARFVGPDAVDAGGVVIRARRFVIATGAVAAVPEVAGIAALPFLTAETILDLDRLPRHLLVLGGGAAGVELAQAFRRLGAAVTLIEATTLLPREDPELVEAVRRQLRRDGIVLHEGTPATAATAAPLSLRLGDEADPRWIAGSHLLVATGRRSCLDGLDLAAAGIDHGADGIRVDAALRTTNRRVYAIGEAIAGPHLPHLAMHQATLVLRSALFRMPARNELSALPSVIHTEPELAQVGLTEPAARAAHRSLEILRWPFADVVGARLDGDRDGFAKIILDGRGRILGAGIVGGRAGELIQPWTLAIAQRLKIGALADTMAPYPSRTEIARKVAASHFLPKLSTDRMKRIVQLLARIP